MKSTNKMYLLLAGFFIAFHLACGQTTIPNTILLDGERLRNNKELLDAGKSPQLKEAFDLLIQMGDQSLNSGPFSVTYKNKENLPKGVSIHDYFSLAPYWWDESNGSERKAYVRRDGVVNTQRDSIPDKDMTNSLCSNVYTLGLAYYFSGDEKYAQKAKELVKVFFLNEDTRMNPNFSYSQIIVGVDGSGGNTIGATAFLKLIDGIQLIENSVSWTSSDDSKTKAWFKEFLTWMLNSDIGKAENNRKNNIGTYYTVQVVSYALFTDQYDLAKQLFKQAAYKRVDEQVDAQGNMPLELQRATPFHYVNFNTIALLQLSMLATKLDVNNFINYENPKGGSIIKAFRKLNKYAFEDRRVSIGKEKVNPSSIRPLVLKYENYVSKATGNRFEIYSKRNSRIGTNNCLDILSSYRF